MQHVSNAYSIQTVSYDDIRPTLRTGDLFFCSGEGWLSGIIKRLTDSPWSHVGMVVQEGPRLMAIEALKHGVTMNRFSHVLRHYEGEIVIARVDALTPAQTRGIVAEAIDRVGIKYNWLRCLQIWWRIRVQGGPPADGRDLICSEFVERCYREAGYSFPYNKRGFVAPEDVWRAPAVSSCLGRLVV